MTDWKKEARDAWRRFQFASSHLTEAEQMQLCDEQWNDLRAGQVGQETTENVIADAMSAMLRYRRF